MQGIMAGEGIFMIDEAAYEDYLKSLLKGERSPCAEIVKRLLSEDTPIKALYTDLFQRSLYRVGELWEHNLISVAVEHLATAITESLLSLVYSRLFTTPRKGHKAVVACTANEYHQLGGKMVADLLEMHGWDTYFLGANTPLKNLLALLDQNKPELLALSLTVYANFGGLMQAIEEVRHHFTALPIVVGGQAFRWGGAEALRHHPGVMLVADLDQLEGLLADPSSLEQMPWE